MAPKKRRQSVILVENSPKSLLDLPDEIIAHILGYLERRFRFQLWRVCTRFKTVLDDWFTWTLNLNCAYLDASTAPITLLQESRKRFHGVNFVHVGLGDGYEPFVRKVCRNTNDFSVVAKCPIIDEDTLKILEIIVSECENPRHMKCSGFIFVDSNRRSSQVRDSIFMKFRSIVLPCGNYSFDLFVNGSVESLEGIFWFGETVEKLRRAFDLKRSRIRKFIHPCFRINDRPSNLAYPPFPVDELYRELLSCPALEEMEFASELLETQMEETKHLDLKRILLKDFSKGHAHNVKELIKFHPNLEKLEVVYGNRDGYRNEVQPTPTINMTFQSLTEIKITSMGTRFSISWLLFNNFPNLQSLSLSNCRFLQTFSDDEELNRFWHEIFQHIPSQLRKLELKNAGKDIDFTFPVLKLFPSLETLTLVNFNWISVEVFTSIKKQSPLKHLSMIRTDNLDDKIFERICKKITNVRSLKISSCPKLGVRSVKAICRHLMELENLQMDGWPKRHVLKYCMENCHSLKNLQTLAGHITTQKLPETPSELGSSSEEEEPRRMRRNLHPGEVHGFFLRNKNVRCLYFFEFFYREQVLKDHGKSEIANEKVPE